MAQHDYNIANQSGADFRADLNNALSAIATVNSGASEPSTTFAHQLWVDTSNNVLKIRNAANSAFITTGVSITASNTFAGALTGNATTATTLQTARTINGTSFDGSANISFNTDSVAEGSSNLYYTGERVDDQVNNLLVGGSGISLVYDDTNNTLTINGQVGDITGITAGSGLVGGGNSGDVSLAVNVDDASIEIDTDVVKVKASGITNAMLAGSIANSKLTNSSVTINSQSLALGGTLVLDTDNIGEGSSNLYYTDARVNSAFDTRLATKDTGDLSEGSNLYYTDARVNAAFDTRLATKDTSNLSEGSNLYFTNERVDDRVSTLIQNGTGISWSYDDASGTFTPTISLSPFNTSQLSESGNLYYTDARARAAISENSAQLSYNSTTGVLTYTQGDTDTVSEGSNNLYYTQSRFNSAFGNKTTADLTENTNLYYTDTRANSAIDARVTKSFVDALGIQATSVADNSVVLGNDTTGNYIQTITGTANKITVSGSGSESADVTITLPDDVQIASDLTVAGNLTVNGTLTSLDTTNLDIEDNLFQLNAGLTGSPVNDSGMLINRGNQNNAVFIWDESADKFTIGLTTADGSATGNITLSSLGTLVANLEGNVTGNITGTVSSISNHDTDNLSEGSSNLYYTQARFDSALAAKSTTNVSEGTNLYYTDARFDTRLSSKDTDDVSEGTNNLYYTSARFNSAFSGKSTSDLSEGTNLYYTDARANAAFDTRLATKDTDNVSEGSNNLYYTDARSNSAFDTRLATKDTGNLAEGSNLYYTDARFDTRLATKDTDDLSEGTTNLYYTDARANTAIDARVTNTFINNLSGVVADTATILATARTINGVSFDGSANITTLTAGTGVTVSGTEVSIGQSVATSSSPTFSNLTLNGTDSLKLPVGTTAQRNGSPSAGMFRYNSTTGEFEGYTTEWGAIAGGGNGSYSTDIFTATSGQTAFTLSASISNENNLIIFVDGVFQAQNTYSVSGTTLTFATGIVVGRIVTVYHIEPVSIGTPSDGTVTSAKLDTNIAIAGTFSTGGATTLNSTLSVSGDITGTLATAAQPNITSLGTLTALTGGTGDLNWDSGTLFVDSSANAVGIGTTSPNTMLHVDAPASPSPTYPTLGTASGVLGLSINELHGMYLGLDGSSGNGWIQAMREDGTGTAYNLVLQPSGGNLMVGTTESNPTSSAVNVAGQAFSTTGGVRSTVASNPAATFNRKTDDGVIALFRKDGTTVGSIGNSGANIIYFAGAGSGVKILNPSSGFDGLMPCSTTGADRDASMDLGSANTRFKDLYLSGGAYIGGTGSANKLDDYEEGTWTPVVKLGTTTVTSTNTGFYTKIGRIITLQVQCGFSNLNSGSGNLTIEGIPFNSADVAHRNHGSVGYYNVADSFGANGVQARISRNSSFIDFMRSHEISPAQNQHMQSNSELYITITYKNE